MHMSWWLNKLGWVLMTTPIQNTTLRALCLQLSLKSWWLFYTWLLNNITPSTCHWTVRLFLSAVNSHLCTTTLPTLAGGGWQPAVHQWPQQDGVVDLVQLIVRNHAVLFPLLYGDELVCATVKLKCFRDLLCSVVTPLVPEPWIMATPISNKSPLPHSKTCAEEHLSPDQLL